MQPNREASDYLRDAITELDPKGRGFTTSAVASVVLERVIEEYGVQCKGGPVVGAALTFLRNGVSAMASNYNPGSKSGKSRKKVNLEFATNAMQDGQSDLAELSDDFAWLEEYTGLNEIGPDSERCRYRHLTYALALQVIELKRRKSSEIARAANRLQAYVTRNPQWARRPHLTLGQVIGID